MAAMIPGASKSQASVNEESPNKDSGGIERPDNDVQVEEFLRKQYRSKSGKDMPSVAER